MPAPVVIDVGVAEPPRELATVLVDACTQAAIGTECRLLRDAPNGPYTAIAIVTWEEGDKARVEVGLRRDPVSEWRTRELTFQAADADIERYRSVGFVIGSLATAAHDEDAPKPASAPKPAPPPPPKPAPAPPPVVVAPARPPQPPPAGPSRGWIGLVGTIGGGLDRGPPRFGGRLGAGVRVIPHLAAVVSVGASTRVRDGQGLVPQWLDAGCGLNVAIWSPQATHLELRGEVIAEQFSVEVRNDGENDSAIRTAAAARVGADGVFVVAEPLALVIGGEAVFRSATKVDVRGQGDGSTRNFELGAVAGLRLDL